MSEAEKPDLTILTVQLLSAYVGNNAVASGELADLVRTTRAALAENITPAAPPVPDYVPAVSVRASLASRDHILSMIDGRRYKSLKRHLSTRGLSPAEYRSRYKLPADYPMVAPNYSEQRREVARKLGLGRKKTATAEIAETPQGEAPSPAPRKPAARAKAAASDAPKAKRKAPASRRAKQPEAQAAE